MNLPIERYLAVAEGAARRAGQVLVQMKSAFTVWQKGWQDLVTNADVAAENAARESVLAAFPRHTVLAEEDQAEFDPDASFRWIIDPLDGTTNYVHGLDYYAVSIALAHEGELLVGVIYAPEREECFRAASGRGAFRNGQRIHVSDVPRLREALVGTGFPPELDRRPDLLELFKRISCRSHAVRRLGSTALNLAYTAAGQFDAFYSATIHSWDVAAGALLVREAGGHVSNLDGRSYSLHRPDIVGSNGRIHDEIIAIAAEVLQL